MESIEFVKKQRYFRFLAGGAVLCFSLHALVMGMMFVGQHSLQYIVYGYSWSLRLVGLIFLGLSLLWIQGWKTKEHARLFGLLFLIDLSPYLFMVSAGFLSSPQIPRPESDPVQTAITVLVLLSMLILSVSLLMGGKGSRVALVVFLTAHATSVFYTVRVANPRLQAWSEAHKLEILERLNAQSAPGATLESVEFRAVAPFTNWGTYTFFLMAFIYIFFLRKSESHQAHPSPPP